ncbi:isochorismatase family protein [Klebsiella michiganensis]|uniref:cysteine hydrolase family protein n=1 Tax=Klebsiella michiganensis TaxID=1134687 RepID=UPI0015E52213|nr:isochorismatase family protein [Klebsiella michiganensis]MBA8301810.1 isochorismatase family protein [Klebsiella michiganensis]MBX8831835.1 isochorismatase family protein [Klebsiella michiganensis]MBX8849961.1 isochorismatase family protein [Klebsiella michiganensis]MBX8870130.1 isochorismatase family protein [Klebsiella michiganensis]MCW9465905.1 isochorismatase family protein [Klebsiella michiganensis]
MKNALIVIDVQNDYFPGGAWPLEGAEEVAAEIVGAVRQAYKEGWMVVGIQHVTTPDASFFRPGNTGTDIESSVATILGSAVVLRKKEADSFYNTGLEELLRGAGITDIWLTGMMTQHGVTHTALSSQARGMRVHVLAKGCAAPTRDLSALALSALQARCRVK